MGSIIPGGGFHYFGKYTKKYFVGYSNHKISSTTNICMYVLYIHT
jgi:hypothetical protein